MSVNNADEDIAEKLRRFVIPRECSHVQHRLLLRSAQARLRSAHPIDASYYSVESLTFHEGPIWPPLRLATLSLINY